MILKIMMKTPDAVSTAIEEALAHKECEDAEGEMEKAKEVCKKWFKYGEYITLEVDTEKKTIQVV